MQRRVDLAARGAGRERDVVDQGTAVGREAVDFRVWWFHSARKRDLTTAGR